MTVRALQRFTRALERSNFSTGALQAITDSARNENKIGTETPKATKSIGLIPAAVREDVCEWKTCLEQRRAFLGMLALIRRYFWFLGLAS
jgi:hypothetical protein